jgi:hypothetical protein
MNWVNPLKDAQVAYHGHGLLREPFLFLAQQITQNAMKENCSLCGNL